MAVLSEAIYQVIDVSSNIAVCLNVFVRSWSAAHSCVAGERAGSCAIVYSVLLSEQTRVRARR